MAFNFIFTSIPAPQVSFQAGIRASTPARTSDGETEACRVQEPQGGSTGVASPVGRASRHAVERHTVP